MRHLVVGIVLSAIVTLPVVAQNNTAAPSLLRAERKVTTSVPSNVRSAGKPFDSGAREQAYRHHDECVAVFTDGRIRVERMLDFDSPIAPAATNSKTKVYLGKLTDRELTQLKAIRDDEKFRAITVDLTGKDADLHPENKISLQAWITREGGEQHFNFPDTQLEGKHSKALRSFESWWNALDRKNLPEAAVVPNQCTGP